jgi:hypothetical protein
MEINNGKPEVSCLIYVAKGTSIYALPKGFGRHVQVKLSDRTWLNDSEIYFLGEANVSKWDCWEVTGATAGFTSNGHFRLTCDKTGQTLTWTKNTRRIYGYTDYSTLIKVKEKGVIKEFFGQIIRFNYRLCHKCGKIAGKASSSSSEYFDRDKGMSLLTFECTCCGHVWEVEKSCGRPREDHENEKVFANFKPAFRNNKRRKTKPVKNKNFN